MLKRIFIVAFTMTLFFMQNVYAEEVTVYVGDDNTTYCVDNSTVEYTEKHSDIAFKAKVISYYKTYSPQTEWYFFEEEEDGTVAYVVGEGGYAHTVKRGDEPAYSVYKFCLKYLYGGSSGSHGKHKDDPYFTGG